jgi:putative SOS response-associated peptidase YedK
MFRDAFRRTRCLIPASGYYEWQTRSEGKQPYYITPADGSMLTIAGLWSDWRDRVNDETLTTCTMIITEANSFISAIHDPMPCCSTNGAPTRGSPAMLGSSCLNQRPTTHCACGRCRAA